MSRTDAPSFQLVVAPASQVKKVDAAAVSLSPLEAHLQGAQQQQESKEKKEDKQESKAETKKDTPPAFNLDEERRDMEIE